MVAVVCGSPTQTLRSFDRAPGTSEASPGTSVHGNVHHVDIALAARREAGGKGWIRCAGAVTAVPVAAPARGHIDHRTAYVVSQS